MKYRLFPLCLSLLALLPVPAARAELPDAVRFSVVLELGDVRQARAWLDEGLDPNFEGHLIGTGLMIGAWEGNIPLMELFLARGADLQRTNRFGEQALMLAVWKGQHEAVQWLLARGANPNRTADREWTALHYASFAGHAELVGKLIDAGANVNARSTNGSTVLMMAAREGHETIAKQLLAAGANPVLKNDFADDALAWATRHHHSDIARTLSSAISQAPRTHTPPLRPATPPPQAPSSPDTVEEHLRMARLAASRGKRDEALAAYRKALAELKPREEPKKTAARASAEKVPTALTIRAQRTHPSRQTMYFTYGENTEPDVDQLLERARAAEAAGKRQEALRLYRQASARLRN